ncbi:TPA: recombinase family protein [Escherichia coli]|nr:recombinase family protein [Escherichia coli]
MPKNQSLPAVSDFRRDFPQFADPAKYSEAQIQFRLNLADELLSENVTGKKLFPYFAGLFVAHYMTLWAADSRAMLAGGSGGSTNGVQSSKSVDKVVDGVGDIIEWWGKLDAETKTLIEVIGGLVVAMRILNSTFWMSPIGLITGLIVALGLLWEDYKTWKEGGNSLIDWEKWQPAIDKAKDAITWLRDHLLELKDGVGGWQNALEILGTFIAGVWVSKVLGAFGKISGLPVPPWLKGWMAYAAYLYSDRENIGASAKSSWDYTKQNIGDSLRWLGIDTDFGRNPHTVKGANIQSDIPGAEPEQHAQATKRGERNNNPGNLNFAGQAGASLERPGGRFARFETAFDGLRALARQLMLYAGRGINSVEKIISTWAPASDNNNTTAYIRAVVDILSTLFHQQSRKIGMIVPSVVISEKHTDMLEITEHPVEVGAAVADHAYKKPSEVVMEVGFAGGGALLDFASNLTATSLLGLSPQQTYQELLDLQESRIPFDVVTGKRLYSNMLIRALEVTTDKTTENVLSAVLTLREVIISRTQQITVADKTNMKEGASTSAVQNSGNKTTKPPDTSLLKSITGIGYVRVSTNDQNTDLQRNALSCAGCELIFEDKISGTKSERPGLKKLLRTLSAGDTLVVWKLDRLGRSVRHLVVLVEELCEQGVNFSSDVITGGGFLPLMKIF